MMHTMNFEAMLEDETSCRPFRPEEHNKQVIDEIIEDQPIFSFVGIFGGLSFAGSAKFQQVGP